MGGVGVPLVPPATYTNSTPTQGTESITGFDGSVGTVSLKVTDASMTSGTGSPVIMTIYANATNRIYIQKRATGSKFRIVSAATSETTEINDSELSAFADGSQHFLIAWDSTNLKIFCNGVLFAHITGTYAMPVSITAVDIAQLNGGTNAYSATLGTFKYWDSFLTDEQCAEITSDVEILAGITKDTAKRLYGFLGQSNSVGQAGGTASYINTSNIFALTNAGVKGAYADPYGDPTGSLVKALDDGVGEYDIGYAGFFADKMYQLSGIDTMVVPANRSSTSFAGATPTWAVNSSGNRTGGTKIIGVEDTAFGAFNQLKWASQHSTLQGIIWGQGEGDAATGTSQGDYETHLTDLINIFRQGLRQSTLPIYLAGMPVWDTDISATEAAYNAIIDAQKAVATAMDGVYFILDTDKIGIVAEEKHYDLNSNEIVGETIAGDVYLHEGNAWDFNMLPMISLLTDSSDETTITEAGGLVSQWDDIGGKDNHITQGTGSRQPETGTRTQNSLNALDFATDAMVMPSGLYDCAEGNNTVFTVFVPDSFGGNQILMDGDGTSFAYRPAGWMSGSNLISIHGDGSPDSEATLSGVIDNTPHVGVMRKTTTAHESRLDGGVPATSVTSSNVTMTKLYLGATTTPSAYFDGLICQVLICNTDLSDRQLDLAGNKIKEKWATPWLDTVITAIPNLGLWLDGSDSSTITHLLGSVSQWDDKSGNDYHATQGTASLQPTYSEVDNSLSFSDDALSLPSATGVANTSASTMFIVYSEDIDQTNPLYSQSDGGSAKLHVHARATGNVRIEANGAEVLSSGLSFDNDKHVIVAGNDTVDLFLHKDGGVADTATVGTPTALTSPASLGNRDFNSSHLDGKIYEVIFYERALTDTEKNTVGNYLADKWDFTWTNI